MADTYHVGYYGDPNPQTCAPTRTQPGGRGVRSAELHPSGQWLTLVDDETGQITMERIRPDTTLIVLDREDGDDLG